MTAPTPQLEWAGELSTAIGEADNRNVRPARHVLARLTALLYPHEFRHVDVDLKADDARPMRVSGTITVFTDQLVAVTSVNDMLAMPTGAHQTEVHQPTDVEVTVVPRSRLQRVSMVQTGTDWADHNTSIDWQSNAGDLNEWPFTGRVSLFYDGLAEPVVVPSGRNRNTDLFQRFLPKLMADLID